jgi:hypothetical protein
MADRVVIETEVGADGKVVLQLPDDAPHGFVRITVEKIEESVEIVQEEIDAELEQLFQEGGLYGRGLTAEEILRSPAIGIWKDRTDMEDPVAYLAEERRKRREKRLDRD